MAPSVTRDSAVLLILFGVIIPSVAVAQNPVAGFIKGAVIRWNGAARTTEFVSPTQLLAATFSPSHGFESGVRRHVPGLGDLNNDGKIDIVEDSIAGSAITVFTQK